MRSSSDRQSIQSSGAPQRKRLGGYLVEAGLLTTAQVDVALNDQKLTGMRFGEILAARGWIKQQTIEYLMNKVVLPEQRAIQQQTQTQKLKSAQQEASGNQSERSTAAQTRSPSSQPEGSRQPGRRDIPITKPLPPVNQADNDVSWVG